MLAAAALLPWLYLLLGRGGFWRMRASRFSGEIPTLPRVAAVIPARNEAGVVGAAISSVAKQDYRGEFHIYLIDDASDDGTPEIARAAAPPEMLTVLSGAPLPSGWTGKLWAVAQGVHEAARRSPDYLLLTDADIVHPPGGLSELVARAELGGYDLVSWMVTLRCESPAERALIPAFVFFFFLLYPPAWIADPRRRTAGAAGGCMLIRRNILERIGGIERIRGELIDDCALARAVKQHGGRLWLGLHPDTHSIREYDTFGAIGRMISRSAFTQLRYSTMLLAGTVLGMTATYLVPPVLAFRANIYGAVAWVLMSLAYLPVLRYYRRPAFWAPLLPLVAIFYLASTVHSALLYWTGTGGVWKGRVQAAR